MPSGSTQVIGELHSKIGLVVSLMNEIHSDLLDQLHIVENYHKQLETVKKMQHKKSQAVLTNCNDKQEVQDRIMLNVGGLCYQTERSVLTSPRGEDSMLFAVGMGWFQSEEQKQCGTEVFIDRDGTLFGMILSWLRGGDSCIVLPKQEYEQHNLLNEARYYGLDKLVSFMQSASHSCYLLTTVHLLEERPSDLGSQKYLPSRGQQTTPNCIQYDLGSREKVTCIPNVLIFPKMKAAFDFEIPQGQSLTLSVEDRLMGTRMRWTARLKPAGTHLHCVFDWTGFVESVPFYHTLKSKVLVNDIEWKQADDRRSEIGSCPSHLFVCLIVDSYYAVTAGEITLKNVDVELCGL